MRWTLSLAARSGAMAVAYLAMAALETLVTREMAYGSFVWWAAGLAVVGVYALGARAVPGVILGEFVWAASIGMPLTVSLATGLGHGLEAWAAATLLRRRGFDPRLQRPADVGSLAVAGLLAPCLIALFQGGAYWAAGIAPEFRLWELAKFWMTDFLSISLAGALIFPWLRKPRRVRPPARAVIIFAGVVVTTHLGLVAPDGWQAWQPVFLSAALPFLVWAALTLNVRATGFLVVAHGTVVYASVACGSGVFPLGPGATASFPYVHTYLLMMLYTPLLLAATEARRRAAEATIADGRKLECVGVLAGGIAHEFNNLMTAVLGNAGAVRMMAPGLPREVEARLADVERAALRAAELTRQLLAFAGKAALQRTTFPLAELVRREKERLAAELPPGVGFAEEIGGAFLYDGDARQMSLAVASVLRNAVEAHAERPGTIRISVSIDVIVRDDLLSPWAARNMRPGAAFRVRIEDGGHGIPADVLPNVCDPFFTTKFAGRGLGLAAALGVVKSHGGLLRVSSVAKVGTAVDLVFPILMPSSSLPPPLLAGSDYIDAPQRRMRSAEPTRD